MSDLSQLIIDEEFERVIPPLDEDEFELLKENILQDGEVYLPIMVWNNTIIDGHHRYKILKEHPEIPFRISEKEFGNRYEAISWMCFNQLGRRNLSTFQKTALFGRRYRAEKELRCFHGNQYTDILVSPHDEDSPKKEKTAYMIAKEMGIGHATVERAEQVVDGMDAAEEICPGITKDLMSGKIAPTQQEVAAVAKAPKDKRAELVDMLRKPRQGMKKEELKHRKELFQSYAKLDAMHTDTEKGKTSAENMISCFQSDARTAINNLSSYFKNYPDMLTKPELRELVNQTLSEIEEFIREIKETK